MHICMHSTASVQCPIGQSSDDAAAEDAMRVSVSSLTEADNGTAAATAT